MPAATKYRLGFVMEQTLGHVTHARNLRPRLEADGSVDTVWMPVEFAREDRWQRAPMVRGNWSLRASFRARDMVRAAAGERPLHAVFYHTQTTALFARSGAPGVPCVISLDATPRNIDCLGAAYRHTPSRVPGMERAKDAMMARAFRHAAHLVTWCAWAKASLVQDYGICADKVTVIPPGVDLARWAARRDAPSGTEPTRLLFVGADFARKGGPLLLEAMREIAPGGAQLDVVTRACPEGASVHGVRVHTGLGPNDPELLRLFAEADVFVLPTLGDVLPVVCIEAMAAGLPVVASRVGAIPEEVVEGETGLVVPPGDAAALVHALRRLIGDPRLRRRMGEAGRLRAETLFDADRNYAAIIDLCKRCADERRA